MTLTVTVRVPDGIVIAADSLASLTQTVTQQAEVAGKCPKCNEDVKIADLKLPPVNIPSGGSSNAQKLFKIGKGISAWQFMARLFWMVELLRVI